ncbi:FAD/NAD(P)-binding domain-containing protein [Xylariaceae sp. FL1019]|nr:FAD/NAD(P)-binding domain-containing protein [Xylariaceae sp. FL1019]
MDKVKIAVIGLGPAGLAALKSLREEGFDAIAFERRDQIGGLWAFNSDETYTSALEETLCNVSKFNSGFSDFPVSKDASTYFTSQEVAEYLEGYASKFGLHPHIRFGSTVNRVTRNEADDKWDVHISTSKGSQTLPFDKVVFGHGNNSVPSYPTMPNRTKFKGTIMHGQTFKGPKSFAGKRVLVVGIGNSACDASLSLVNHASKVYQSYRRGRLMVSRYENDGLPLGTQFAWPMLRLKYVLDRWFPSLMRWVGDNYMINKMITDASRSEPAKLGESPKDRWKRTEQLVRGDWRLLPAASMAHDNPTVQEHFIPALRRGDIVPMHGFKDFCGASEVLLMDGTVVEVDAVIFCTGYELEFSIMPEIEMDGACGMELQTAGNIINKRQFDESGTIMKSSEERKLPHLPRLYQTIFPPRWASSIAFLSWMAPQENAWCVAELAAMAVAQIWAGETAGKAPNGNLVSAKLPSVDEMNNEVDAYHAWWRQSWQEEHSMLPGYVRAYSFYRFLHGAAGTGLYERLDHMFSTPGWDLWWNDHELWTWLAKGPMNSYSWRLFETNPGNVPGCGRKTWPEARKTLKEAYEIFQDYKRQQKDKSKDD